MAAGALYLSGFPSKSLFYRDSGDTGQQPYSSSSDGFTPISPTPTGSTVGTVYLGNWGAETVGLDNVVYLLAYRNTTEWQYVGFVYTGALPTAKPDAIRVNGTDLQARVGGSWYSALV